MKIMDSPRTGKLASVVFYPSRFGQCARTRTIPRDPKTERQNRMRAIFGSASRSWGVALSEDQRLRWVAAAQAVPSHPSLAQYSYLSGQQFHVQINSTLQCIGLPPVSEPPAPVTFGPNPVSDLVIDHDPEKGTRLRLNIGPASEDIMVFGQAPCSAGRMKSRRVYYLGLLCPAADSQRDITDLYTARFGRPAPGQKVFIATCQTKDGWKARESVFSAIVPPAPSVEKRQVPLKAIVTTPAPAAKPQPSASAAKVSPPLHQAMYQGSTWDVPRENKAQKYGHLTSIPGTPLVHSVWAALRRLLLPGMREVEA